MFLAGYCVFTGVKWLGSISPFFAEAEPLVKVALVVGAMAALFYLVAAALNRVDDW